MRSERVREADERSGRRYSMAREAVRDIKDIEIRHKKFKELTDRIDHDYEEEIREIKAINGGDS